MRIQRTSRQYSMDTRVHRDRVNDSHQPASVRATKIAESELHGRLFPSLNTVK
jgi:hypothetical protein